MYQAEINQSKSIWNWNYTMDAKTMTQTTPVMFMPSSSDGDYSAFFCVFREIWKSDMDGHYL